MISTRRFCGSRTPWAGGHQQMRLAEAMDGDRVARHAVAHQLGGDRVGAADRQAHVVLRRARRIGVAVDLDLRVLDVGRVLRRFADDLAGAIGQRRLIPVEEHEIGPRRCRSRSGDRSRRRRRRRGYAEIVAEADQEGVVVVLPELNLARAADGFGRGSDGADGTVAAVSGKTHEAVLGGQGQAGHGSNRNAYAGDRLVGETAFRAAGGDAADIGRGPINVEILQACPLIAHAGAEVRHNPRGQPIEVISHVDHRAIQFLPPAGSGRTSRLAACSTC